MKKSIVSSLLLLSATTLLSQTTMCFKENHSSMSTIENTKLNGGECKSQNSVNDMKNQGWKVDDIKITTTSNGMNFIYIFKKPNSTDSSNAFVTNESQEDMEKRILAKLEKKKEIEKKEKELEKKINLTQKGKSLYIKKCESCHGKNGEKVVHPKAELLKNLSYKDIKFYIARYTSDMNYGHGKQILMRPFALNTNSKELKAIKTYLESIN